jgi:hypothetical protein
MTKVSALVLFRTHKIPIILTLALVVLSYASLGGDLKLFLGLIVIIPIFTLYGFDGRIPVGIALLILLSAAILFSLNQVSVAQELAIRCYFLLIVGVSCLIIELLREKITNMKIFKNEHRI